MVRSVHRDSLIASTAARRSARTNVRSLRVRWRRSTESGAARADATPAPRACSSSAPNRRPRAPRSRGRHAPRTPEIREASDAIARLVRSWVLRCGLWLPCARLSRPRLGSAKMSDQLAAGHHMKSDSGWLSCLHGRVRRLPGQYSGRRNTSRHDQGSTGKSRRHGTVQMPGENSHHIFVRHEDVLKATAAA